MNSNPKDPLIELNAITILVLDDEPLIRLMVCSKLEQAGARVSEARDCAEALELVRNTDFDAAIFDYRLPDGDGLDVVRQLRAEGYNFPIAMLSGEASDIEEEAYENMGICAVFPKPPDVEKIAAALLHEVGGMTIQPVVQVGRYAYWVVDPAQMNVSNEWMNKDWLAIDVSGWSDSSLPDSLIACIRLPHRGIAVVGANSLVRKSFEKLGVEIDFVANKDELAALSRRPYSRQERVSLLGVTQSRR